MVRDVAVLPLVFKLYNKKYEGSFVNFKREK